MSEIRLMISVLMPVYNAEKYIAAAVNSILNQTFTNFEFIIINDGSTDNTSFILDEYARQDARIRLVSRENKGLVATLNEGIAIAKAPLIARMDADDIALPNRLEVQKEFMDNHPGAVCVGSKAHVIDNHGRYLIDTKPKLSHEDIVLSALQGVSPITHPTALIRAEAMAKVGGYKFENYPAEDLALWIDLSECGELANLDEPLIEYRIHDGSISTSSHEVQLAKTVEICQIACQKRNITFDMKTKAGRPAESSASKFDIVLRHGWWAHSSQQWHTSAIYALKAIRWMPFNDGGWRLLFCSFFRRN